MCFRIVKLFACILGVRVLTLSPFYLGKHKRTGSRYTLHCEIQTEGEFRRREAANAYDTCGPALAAIIMKLDKLCDRGERFVVNPGRGPAVSIVSAKPKYPTLYFSDS
jgi:hypothetical protein